MLPEGPVIFPPHFGSDNNKKEEKVWVGNGDIEPLTWKLRYDLCYNGSRYTSKQIEIMTRKMSLTMDISTVRTFKNSLFFKHLSCYKKNKLILRPLLHSSTHTREDNCTVCLLQLARNGVTYNQLLANPIDLLSFLIYCPISNHGTIPLRIVSLCC